MNDRVLCSSFVMVVHSMPLSVHPSILLRKVEVCYKEGCQDVQYWSSIPMALSLAPWSVYQVGYYHAFSEPS